MKRKRLLLADLTDAVIPAACDAWGSPGLGDEFRAPRNNGTDLQATQVDDWQFEFEVAVKPVR
ncbi:MAG TPA: hypothetical protein VGB76_01975 [Pyrinomonadaceae bacterium]